RLLAAHLIAGEDVARPLPCACAEELERDAWLPIKDRRALTGDHGEDGQVQFVHQIVNKQIIPEHTAQYHQNIPARTLLERGDLLVGVRQPDNARVVPGRQFVLSDLVRDDDLLDALYEVGELTPDGCGFGILWHTGPVSLVPQEGVAPTQQQGVGCAKS